MKTQIRRTPRSINLAQVAAQNNGREQRRRMRKRNGEEKNWKTETNTKKAFLSSKNFYILFVSE